MTEFAVFPTSEAIAGVLKTTGIAFITILPDISLRSAPSVNDVRRDMALVRSLIAREP